MLQYKRTKKNEQCKQYVLYLDALSDCVTVRIKYKVNAISITKAFVQWAQQLLVPLWDCTCKHTHGSLKAGRVPPDG